MIDLALFVIVRQNDDDLARLPLQLKHDLNEVDEANCTIFDWLRRSARKEHLLDLGRACVKPTPELDALLYQVLLAVLEHAANHLPCDVDEAVLDEMVRHIHIVLVNCDFESELIESESVH